MRIAWKIAVVAILLVLIAAVLALRTRQTSPGQSAAHPPVSSGLPRLIDLGSVTCIPCKMMTPVLEELRRQYGGRLHVQFIDVNRDPAHAQPYAVKRIPTQIFLDHLGCELWRHEGFISKEEILAKWKELGIDLASPMPAGDGP